MTIDTDRTKRPFAMDEAVELLARTPAVLDVMLRGLPQAWVTAHEGGETWSPFDVVGHLIHSERTNWIPRARHLLEYGEARAFEPFDRFAQFEQSRGLDLPALLDTFAAARKESLRALEELHLTSGDLERRGKHPGLGAVTLGQLLSSWVVHDLDHLMQISRVLARQYVDAVGPWREYLRIVRDVPA